MRGFRIWNPYAPPVVNETEAGHLIEALNKERASRGLNALGSSPELAKVAQSWAARMAEEGHLYHGDFSSRIAHVFPNTYAGEDIAEGQPTVEEVMKAWMFSLPHRKNILGNFNYVGVGIARSADGTIYWCVDFDQNK